MHCGINYKCCDKFNGETTEVKTEGILHYGKAVCKFCGHFIKWLPNPKVTEEFNKRRTLINKLLELPKIGESHTKFLVGIKDLKKISPKQLKYLQDLEGKYL